MRRLKAGNATFIRTILVRAAPRDRRRAVLQAGPLCIPAAIGRSGITAFKREGDGATPRASMRILGGYVRGDRIADAKSLLDLKRIRRTMLWCDAPGDANYNRPVAHPFKKSHEELMREDGLYDIVLVMDWNVTCRAQGRGSAIFFHLIRPGYEPTAGCVAIARRDMLRLLPHIGRRTTVRVAP
ncbi:hypothetical protein NOF55_19535 [Rhizobiaceae bacterium BDR2-2]|uniref:L,D-TPase catalytic domain-containing protein n=1 Tax=Ectorhizobium quercum TaxID=2965071 RepID=A0AAE3N3L6_9HYPH|nr:L,D-transpeptidase family protein [Ectorhizobium quercum]MCX8999301.1 hypothetical protein [Ectorhizobium quercum]